MDELMIVANVAIIFGVMYKLFELYAKRKERIMLIEKLPPELLDKEKVKCPNSSSPSGFFSALRMGCLFLGIGLGLIAGYCIVYTGIFLKLRPSCKRNRFPYLWSQRPDRRRHRTDSRFPCRTEAE